jgi:hypothetical protein
MDTQRNRKANVDAGRSTSHQVRNGYPAPEDIDDTPRPRLPSVFLRLTPLIEKSSRARSPHEPLRQPALSGEIRGFDAWIDPRTTTGARGKIPPVTRCSIENRPFAAVENHWSRSRQSRTCGLAAQIRRFGKCVGNACSLLLIQVVVTPFSCATVFPASQERTRIPA